MDIKGGGGGISIYWKNRGEKISSEASVIKTNVGLPLGGEYKVHILAQRWLIINYLKYIIIYIGKI